MATNTTQLLYRLQNYQDSLERHLSLLTQDYRALEHRWHALNVVYEGQAASQFRDHWLRTTARFEEYISATQKINRLLTERINALNEADRPGDLG